VFRSLRGLAPEYLSHLCHSVSTVPGRASRRSSAHGQLLVPKIKTKLYRNRSFAVSGPVEWNIGDHPPFMIAQFLSRPSKNDWKLICFSAKIMSSKNSCALEFALILGSNIKFSVIIIINLIKYEKKVPNWWRFNIRRLDSSGPERPQALRLLCR